MTLLLATLSAAAFGFLVGCTESYGHDKKIKKQEHDNICNIIFEGEETVVGREITIERIKECINYSDWLSEDNGNDD